MQLPHPAAERAFFVEWREPPFRALRKRHLKQWLLERDLEQGANKMTAQQLRARIDECLLEAVKLDNMSETPMELQGALQMLATTAEYVQKEARADKKAVARPRTERRSVQIFPSRRRGASTTAEYGSGTVEQRADRWRRKHITPNGPEMSPAESTAFVLRVMDIIDNLCLPFWTGGQNGRSGKKREKCLKREQPFQQAIRQHISNEAERIVYSVLPAAVAQLVSGWPSFLLQNRPFVRRLRAEIAQSAFLSTTEDLFDELAAIYQCARSDHLRRLLRQDCGLFVPLQHLVFQYAHIVIEAPVF
jgi:hypothetical protein